MSKVTAIELDVQLSFSTDQDEQLSLGDCPKAAKHHRRRQRRKRTGGHGGGASERGLRASGGGSHADSPGNEFATAASRNVVTWSDLGGEAVLKPTVTVATATAYSACESTAINASEGSCSEPPGGWHFAPSVGSWYSQRQTLQLSEATATVVDADPVQKVASVGSTSAHSQGAAEVAAASVALYTGAAEILATPITLHVGTAEAAATSVDHHAGAAEVAAASLALHAGWSVGTFEPAQQTQGWTWVACGSDSAASAQAMAQASSQQQQLVQHQDGQCWAGVPNNGVPALPSPTPQLQPMVMAVAKDGGDGRWWPVHGGFKYVGAAEEAEPTAWTHQEQCAALTQWFVTGVAGEGCSSPAADSGDVEALLRALAPEAYED